jgi:hypothetical protein
VTQLRRGAKIRPCVIKVDGQQACAHAITELKRRGELGRRAGAAGVPI